MRPKTTTLYVIIAALVAVDIALRVSPREAVAQDQFEFEAARFPHVIQVETQDGYRVYRLWSDDVIEWANFGSMSTVTCLPNPPAVAWQEIAETVPLPPGVRITRIYTVGNSTGLLLRLRSDGVVEQNWLGVYAASPGWCGWRTPPE